MRGLRIGSAFGIPIRLNWTFLLILPFFAFLIGSEAVTIAELMNEMGANITLNTISEGPMPWILGFVAAIGLFVGVLLHELGHSLVAIRYGYEIDSITLWLLGGVASLTEVPEDWRHEFLIAIAGPIVSVGVGVSCYIVFFFAPASADSVLFVFGYLALLNVFLAGFNMLPAFPMDGGRVLRAFLARSQPHAQATQQAATVGKIFAFLMALVGLVANWLLILLALFIYIAASGEAKETTLKAAFEGVSVADVMTPREQLDTVSAEMRVAELIEQMFQQQHTGYPVMDGPRLVGIVTLEDASSIQEVERDAYRVEDIMETDIQSVSLEADAMDALQTMRQHSVGRLPVFNNRDEFVGIISRTDLMTALDIIQKGGRPEKSRSLPSANDERFA